MTYLSYAKGPEAPLLEMTLADALAQTAARLPDRMALVVRHQNLRYTWREFDAMVTRVALLTGLAIWVFLVSEAMRASQGSLAHRPGDLRPSTTKALDPRL